MLKLSCLLLVTCMIRGSLSERISPIDSPTWSRRTTEDYGFGSDSRSGARSPSFEGDSDSVRPFGSGTDRDSARRFTHTWERDQAAEGVTRSSYLDRFTTQRSAYGSGSAFGADSDRDSSAYGYGSSRRPSYQTDRWGDAVGGDRTTPRTPYESVYDRTTQRSPYGSGSVNDRDTTSRYGSYGDRTSAWGLGSRTTSRYGSSDSLSGSGYAYSSGLGSGRDRDSYDPNNAYVHLEAELVKLTNEKGVTSTGSKCDTFGACDTVCYGYLDTERPNAEFPGARDQKYWPKLYETDDNNSPSFSRANVTREVCGVPYREATFRVYCEDRDSIGASDLINNWDCNIQRSPEGETFATWHSGLCTPKFQADKMTLTFRYKIHTVSRARCDPSIGAIAAGGASTTTTRRRS